MIETADEVTPIDRPLMRSDIESLRTAVHGLQSQQLQIYEGIKRAQTEPRLMAVVCFVCALVSIGCAVVGLQ